MSGSRVAKIRSAADAAESTWKQLELLRDVRDLERYRELFFDLNVADMGPLIPLLGAPVLGLVRRFSPNLAKQVKERSGMTLASKEERQQRQADLDRMRQRLEHRFDLHPDRIRGEVRRLLQGNQWLHALVPLHDQLTPTDRFHAHEFGDQLDNHVTRVTDVATKSSLALAELLEPAIQDLKTPIARHVRSELSVLSTDDESRARYFATLASDHDLFTNLIKEIVRSDTSSDDRSRGRYRGLDFPDTRYDTDTDPGRGDDFHI